MCWIQYSIYQKKLFNALTYDKLGILSHYTCQPLRQTQHMVCYNHSLHLQSRSYASSSGRLRRSLNTCSKIPRKSNGRFLEMCGIVSIVAFDLDSYFNYILLLWTDSFMMLSYVTEAMIAICVEGIFKLGLKDFEGQCIPWWICVIHKYRRY